MSCRICKKELPEPLTLCIDCLADELKKRNDERVWIVTPPHIKENRFGGDLIEYGAITALFEDIPESEVGVTSGAQTAFTAARQFIKEMILNQCSLAGCSQEHWGFVHSQRCWFTKRRNYYADRAAKS